MVAGPGPNSMHLNKDCLAPVGSRMGDGLGFHNGLILGLATWIPKLKMAINA
jgi:hypothetical protein